MLYEIDSHYAANAPVRSAMGMNAQVASSSIAIALSSAPLLLLFRELHITRLDRSEEWISKSRMNFQGLRAMHTLRWVYKSICSPSASR